jgi:hypothetical protein
VDENTVFATLIFEVGSQVEQLGHLLLSAFCHIKAACMRHLFAVQGSALPHVDCFPQPIMRWTEGYYSRVFEGLHSDFRLRENGENKRTKRGAQPW